MTTVAAAGRRPAPQNQFPGLGSWVELHQEPCRGGRSYQLLVNHRTQQAIALTDAEAGICRQLQAGAGPEESDPAAGAFVRELAEEGFLAGNPPPAQPGRRVTASAAALDVHWNGADRLVRAAHHHGGRHLFHPVGRRRPGHPRRGRPGRGGRRDRLPPGCAPARPPGPDPGRDRPEPGRRRGARVRPRPGRGPLPAPGGRRRDPAAPGHARLLRPGHRRAAAHPPPAPDPGRGRGVGRMAVHRRGRPRAVAGAVAARRAHRAPVRAPQRRHHRLQPAPLHRPGRLLAARRRPPHARPGRGAPAARSPG